MTIRNHAWALSTAALLALNTAALSASPDDPLARSNRGGRTTTGTGTTTTTTGTGTTTTTGTGTGTGSGGPGDGCPSGPGGGHGGGPGGGLLITGTITAIDTVTGTITVTPTGGGTASVLAVTSNTNLIGHETIAASAIALGDTLEVTGVPLAVQATSIVDDHLSTATTGTSSGTTSSSGSSSGTAPTPGTLRIVGVVTALVPATIEVANTFSLALTVTSGTTFAEVLPLTFSQLAVGETVRVVATKSGTTLTATAVDAAPAGS